MDRSEVERETRFANKEDTLNSGYKDKRLLEVEPWKCPPDLLHMQKAIITKLLKVVISICISSNTIWVCGQKL